ncbi:MAG TPA: Re/Si-specific NAD(P)(+) transhydrogenase subunit alpha [Acidobacteriota bacterium]|nr:Re/Si-specific NAD(P)(+) transhydrogenase subunit alpha [Acidobacteriota bacterium]
MKLFVPREVSPGEHRVAAVPETVKRLVELGLEVHVEKSAGDGSGFSDEAFAEAGAKLAGDRPAALADADIVTVLDKLTPDEAAKMKRGALLIGFLDPLNSHDLVETLAGGGISAISMEFLPRTTLAQKMDALSSQANLGGYVAVVLVAERMKKIFPMMMTPAGTIPPARVFIIGAGVAGLQAIATAKRLGARVEAFDTRDVVREQVESLGAKFVIVDLGETGQTKDGYAKALTDEQLARQREALAKHCANADVVITTAQVFGRKAPLIVTEDMVAGMKPGSVIVDMAVETGGNVAGSKLNEEVVTPNGTKIIGLGKLPNRVATHASLMYASNLLALIDHFWNKEEEALEINLEDEIMSGALVIHGGEVRNEMIKESMQK